MKNLLSFVAMILLMCVSAGAQEVTTATVYFYRYKQFQGSALKPSVYCDGVQLGRVENGHFSDVRYPSDRTLFTLKTNKLAR
jgi:hypothetical protein